VLGGILGLIVGLAVTSPVVLTALSMLPVMSILTPIQNQIVSGTVGFYAAADSAGVVGLQFKVDGSNLGTEITSGSCRASWDSTKTGDGLHTVQAIARDQYNNLSIAPPVTVLVSNPAPGMDAVSLVAPMGGATISGMTNVQVNFAGSVTSSSVTVQVRTTSGARVATIWVIDSQGANWVSFRPDLTLMVPNGQYDLVAVSNSAYSSPVRVTVAGVPVPATLAITTPAAGTTISGPVPIVASVTGLSSATVQLQARTTAGAVATTVSTIYEQNAGSVAFLPSLPALLANGQYDLVAVSGSVSSAPIRITVAGSTLAPPAPPEPPPPPSTLTLGLQATGGRQFVLTATVKKNAVVVSGVTVTFVVTNPKGAKSTYTATTNSSGVATYKGALAVSSPKGTYLVAASATSSGLTASANESFVY
jgi:hypothetical protein